MTLDKNSLRKLRTSDYSKITAEFEKIANPTANAKSFDDDRFWKLERDKAGNGSAVIRVLPEIVKDNLPWVRLFSHGFQGPTGRWYIENSLSSIDEKDPLGDLNSKLWNTGNEADKEQARKQKRRLQYICNVLVISDPKHPENEGKVKLFKFGKKIFDMVMDKARPTFDDETPIFVHDIYEGANFRLRMRQVEGYPSYDKSEFESSSELCGGDEDKMVEALNARHNIEEFLDKKNFKSYEELSRKLTEVLTGDVVEFATASSLSEKIKSLPPVQAKASTKQVIEDEEDDVMDYFKSIAEAD